MLNNNAILNPLGGLYILSEAIPSGLSSFLVVNQLLHWGNDWDEGYTLSGSSAVSVLAGIVAFWLTAKIAKNYQYPQIMSYTTEATEREKTRLKKEEGKPIKDEDISHLLSWRGLSQVAFFFGYAAYIASFNTLMTFEALESHNQNAEDYNVATVFGLWFAGSCLLQTYLSTNETYEIACSKATGNDDTKRYPFYQKWYRNPCIDATTKYMVGTLAAFVSGAFPLYLLVQDTQRLSTYSAGHTILLTCSIVSGLLTRLEYAYFDDVATDRNIKGKSENSHIKSPLGKALLLANVAFVGMMLALQTYIEMQSSVDKFEKQHHLDLGSAGLGIAMAGFNFIGFMLSEFRDAYHTLYDENSPNESSASEVALYKV